MKHKLSPFLILLFVAGIFSSSILAQSQYVGVWEGKSWCTNPNQSPQNFKLTVWIENGNLKCSDHSNSNTFKSCNVNQNGNLVCSWYRDNSNANGIYVFRFNNSNLNQLLGYENTNGISCKQYNYDLKRTVNNDLNQFVGKWRGEGWCINPGGNKSSFKFDIWMENGQLRCSDHSSSNKFYPCVLANDGKIMCKWYRDNSSANGSYVFYFKDGNKNVLLGYEKTSSVSCKEYHYRLLK